MEQVLARALAQRPEDRFATAGQLATALTPGEAANDAPSVVPRAARRRFTRLMAAVATAVVLVAGGLGLWSWGAASPPVNPRLAVLPFADRDPSGDHYFADGTAEAIRNRLAGLSGLDVIGYYRGERVAASDNSVAEIGAELGVAYVLRGSVVKQQLPDGTSRVRVSPELVRVADATIVWAETYEAPLAGIFELQADIAERIAQALDVVILAPERAALAAQPTASPEAWDYYVRGNDFYYRSSMLEDNRRALRMYERAVSIDSSFVLAYVGVAKALTAIYATGERDPQYLARSWVAIERARALDPSLADASFALAALRYAQEEYEEALTPLGEFLQARPGDADALYLQALLLRRLGRWEESLETLRRLTSLVPGDRAGPYALGETHLWLRRYSEAERFVDEAIRRAPEAADGYVLKAWLALVRDGDVQEAERNLREGVEMCGMTEVLSRLVVARPSFVEFGVLNGDLRRGLESVAPNTIAGDAALYYLARAGAYDLRGQARLARPYYDSLRLRTEDRVQVDRDFAAWHSLLGIAYAALGRRSDAVREAEISVSLEPLTEDAFWGAFSLASLAQVYVMVGEYDAAVEQLETLLQIPSPYSPTWLRIHPWWQPLRGHPRFEELLAREN